LLAYFCFGGKHFSHQQLDSYIHLKIVNF
jgi:hypothetical protein